MRHIVNTLAVHIVSFSLLGFRLAPPVVGRVIDLNDIKHVTSQKLLETYFMKGKYHWTSHVFLWDNVSGWIL